MPQLAFFPWLELKDDIDIGNYSLQRFKPGSLPEVDEGLRATFDSVLAPYRDTSDNPVESAVILNRNGRGLIDDLSEEDRDDLFRFAELFAFTALAAREFFISPYFNRGHLRLIIQAFSDPRGGAVVETRRKDGTTREIVPGSIYRVQMPWHVTNPGLPIKPDWALLHALLASREREGWSRLYRGIVLFNQANTDAPDMAPDTELVLTYAAMEQVLGISSRSDRKQFHAIFAEAWHSSREVPRSEWRRVLPTSRPRKKDSLRARWAHDLKACRGNLAHGKDDITRPAQWTVREHLLLTAFTVPRLVKQVLSRMDLYEPTEDDERDINALEPLLNLPNLFERTRSMGDGESRATKGFAWQHVLPSCRSLGYVLKRLEL